MTLACAAAVRGQQRYAATSVPVLVGLPGARVAAINNLGQLAGTYYPAGSANPRAFFFNGRSTIDLGTLGGTYASAKALNDAGQIVGISENTAGTQRPFIYDGGVMKDLGGFPGSSVGQPTAINASGQVVGYETLLPRTYALTWNGGSLTDLGTLGGTLARATSINRAGRVVGSASAVDFTPSHAFLFDGASMRDLAPANSFGSAANAINDRNEIVGSLNLAGGARHAMLYAASQLIDLGTLGGPNATANAINNSGAIVGNSYTTSVGGICAFICVKGQLLNLNVLTDFGASGAAQLTDATSINDRGQIICTGNIGGENNVLLTPISETGTSGIVNFSLRASAGTADRTLIAGFVVTGTATKALLRGVGPTLSEFGIASPMADPSLAVYSASALIAHNDDWSESAVHSEMDSTVESVGAFPLPPNSKDAALICQAGAGTYSVQIDSKGSTGIALVEYYDAGPNLGEHLANASARLQVGTGDGAAVFGFVIAGNKPRTVLIRAVGPTLATFRVAEVLIDPRLSVRSKDGVLASNDDWGTAVNPGALAAAAVQTGAFPLPAGSKDSGLVVTLRPGVYSAQVSSTTGTPGVALVEIYDLF